MLDALVVGGMLCTILNNSDYVKIACLTELVDAISPIHTEKDGGVLKYPTFYPFMHVSNYGRETVIKNLISCDNFTASKFGELPVIHSSTTYDEINNELNVFVVNYDQENDIELKLNLSGFGSLEIMEHQIMNGNDLFATNSFGEPANITPRLNTVNKSSGKEFTVILPKLSWNVIRFEVND